MRKALVPFLVLGLLLLGVSPAMAAAEQAKAAPPAQQDEVVQVVVVPEGSPLAGQELEQTKGTGGWDIVEGLMIIGNAINNMRDAIRSRDAVKATWAAVEFVVGAGWTAWGVGTALLPVP